MSWGNPKGQYSTAAKLYPDEQLGNDVGLPLGHALLHAYTIMLAVIAHLGVEAEGVAHTKFTGPSSRRRRAAATVLARNSSAALARRHPGSRVVIRLQAPKIFTFVDPPFRAKLTGSNAFGGGRRCVPCPPPRRRRRPRADGTMGCDTDTAYSGFQRMSRGCA